MNTVNKNILFNYIANFFLALLPLALIPIFNKYLGKAEYGLYSFYATLQAIFAILDAGISPTFSRETARATKDNSKNNYLLNLFRTFEVIYWGISILILIIILIFSKQISTYINAEGIGDGILLSSITLMGFLLFFRWPITLYSSGLIGLQKQVNYNLIILISEGLKAIVSVIVLIYISNSLTVFFYIQILFSILSLILLRRSLIKNLPKTIGPIKIKFEYIYTLKGYLSGVFGISLVSMILSQVDKLLVAKYLTISIFGYYTIASFISSSLSRLVTPIGQAYFPAFVSYISGKENVALIKAFRSACRLIAVFVIPVSLVISFYSFTILHLWTKNLELAEMENVVLSCLILGSCFNALCSIPYNIQLAYGWTKLTLYQNVILIIISIPFLLHLVPIYGQIAAAVFWMIINFLTMILGSYIMFRRIFPGNYLSWIVKDILAPIIISLVFVYLSTYVYNFFNIESSIVKVAYLLFLVLALSFILLNIYPTTRTLLKSTINKICLLNVKS